MTPPRLRRLRRRISGTWSAIPLRVTLVLALVILSGLGLLISGTVVTSVLESSLLRRTDQQLHDATAAWMRPPRQPSPNQPPHLPSAFYIHSQPSGGDGVYVDTRPFNVDAEPELPNPPGPWRADRDPPPGVIGITKPATVGSRNGSSVQWRMITVQTPEATTTVALPLTQNIETVRRLVGLQLVVGLAVLAALAVAAYFVIRRSLRPLRAVEKTAAAIAAGDLYRRVPVRGTNTEVDRLSQSLNGMLAQIQSAFAATEASESAARRSEAKMRRFVADASHELRTPLTTIRGFAELYRQGAIDNPGMFMDRIEREAQRMGLLVEDLLMLARLDAQRPLEQGPVDLLAVASDAVHNARAMAAAADPDGLRRSVELEIHSGEGTLEILGDEQRLRQVLANLLNNALTHTPPSAAVTVGLTPASDEVRLEVADTGPGLPADEADRVFERFYRTDTSRTRASGGTGLGLSIVQALVAAHNGTVEVASAPGEGATFTVRLPREMP
ncbi:sensor histidine kinase [Nocardia australiensis]|uniref:sensor histidine kinase n=1 Tax=Nocardia australiensis TaxID=2887191 RepID=UPI001D1523D2|nr:HAMP domain-containing sensor histidine kinase [Nocardia australiensis]